ncbi:terpenoid synthase [Armillaria solidipes]|uniref:Terpenoid synthase n=1 Tax=Armillaria solidipes TaxID=1076256 RepID=A0A2H3BAK4_9AGAR|nr:terpenoid synthase [Armillaria solidipes]
MKVSSRTKCTISGRETQSWASSFASLGGHLLTFKQKRPQDVSDILRDFLRHFDTTDLPSISDTTLQDLRFSEAGRRGYSIDVLSPSLVLGVHIVASAYHFVENNNTKVFIAFVTMFLAYLDDAYPDEPDILIGVAKFTKLFGSSERHPNKVLNDFSGLLNETYSHFGEVAADFIVHACLRFVTARVLEVQGSTEEPVHKDEEYILYLRGMSGIPEAFAMFIFPRKLPYHVYVQALPSICQHINFTNDVLSFYKEEYAGETGNFISLLAEARGEPKDRVLRWVAEQCVESYDSALLLLSPHKDAHGTYKEFTKGYLAFHLGSKRYRLGGLNL